MLLSLLLWCSLLTTSSAVVVFAVGQCPDIPAIPGFDINRYLGRWYNYENFDAPYQLGMSCVTATYGLQSNGAVSVANEGYRDISAFGRLLYRSPVQALGEAVILNPAQESKLYVSFGDQPSFSITTEPRANYQIVDSDYDTYSLVYSCVQIPFVPIKSETAWILTRHRDIRPANYDQLKQTLVNYGVDISNFKKVDQYRC